MFGAKSFHAASEELAVQNCSQSGRSTLQMKFSLITIKSAAKFINLMRCIWVSPETTRPSRREISPRNELKWLLSLFISIATSIKSSSGRRHAHISPRPVDRLANVKMHLSRSPTSQHTSQQPHTRCRRIFGPEIFINVSVIAADKGQKLKNNILGGYLCMCCVCEREFRIRRLCGEMVRERRRQTP